MGRRDVNLDDLFDDAPWKGISCTSYFWPFTERKALFEARRAIANMTHGLRYAVRGESHFLAEADEVSVDSVLMFVSAANDVQKAANVALQETVAEAKARGATWRHVGDALGIQRTAAQKRFGAGIGDRRRDELKLETAMIMMIGAYWTGQIPEDNLGFDDSYWEDLPVEAGVDFALRTIVKAAKLLDECIEHEHDSDEVFFKSLYRVYDNIRTALHLLMLPRSIEVLASHARSAPVGDQWDDVNPTTYFVHAIASLAFSFEHFNRLFESLRDERESFLKRFYYIYRNLTDAINSIVRPECIAVFARVEAVVVETGCAVMVEKGGDKPVAAT